MSDILVENLDETVVQRLESRARESGRSLQTELRLILEQAASQKSSRLSRAAYRALTNQICIEHGDGRMQTDSAALLAEDRAR
jgi:plasmid stability protein